MAPIDRYLDHVRQELQQLDQAGLFKAERIIATPQGAHVRTADGRTLVNLCANNYLGQIGRAHV